MATATKKLRVLRLAKREMGMSMAEQCAKLQEACRSELGGCMVSPDRVFPETQECVCECWGEMGGPNRLLKVTYDFDEHGDVLLGEPEECEIDYPTKSGESGEDMGDGMGKSTVLRSTVEDALIGEPEEGADFHVFRGANGEKEMIKAALIESGLATEAEIVDDAICARLADAGSRGRMVKMHLAAEVEEMPECSGFGARSDSAAEASMSPTAAATLSKLLAKSVLLPADTSEALAKAALKGIVTLVAYPHYPEGEGDAQGERANEEEIREAAYEWLAKSRKFNIEHGKDSPSDVVVASDLLRNDWVLSKTRTVPAGSWVVTVQLCKSSLAKFVKGELTGASIEGFKELAA